MNNKIVISSIDGDGINKGAIIVKSNNSQKVVRAVVFSVSEAALLNKYINNNTIRNKVANIN